MVLDGGGGGASSCKSSRMEEMEMNSNAGIRCLQCPAVFNWQWLLEEHTFWHHGGAKTHHKCDSCEKKFLDMDSLRFHKKNDHGGEDVGGFSSSGSPFFIPVILFNKKTNTWDCVNCDSSFSLQSQLEEHVQMHAVRSSSLATAPASLLSSYSTTPPSSIPKVFQGCSVPAPNQIILFDKKWMTWECIKCGMTFISQCLLEEHAQTHSTSPFSSPPSATDPVLISKNGEASVLPVVTPNCSNHAKDSSLQPLPLPDNQKQVEAHYYTSPFSPPPSTTNPVLPPKNGETSVLPVVVTPSNHALDSSSLNSQIEDNQAGLLKIQTGHPAEEPTELKKKKIVAVVKEGAHRLCVIREDFKCKKCKKGYLNKVALDKHKNECHHHRSVKRNLKKKLVVHSEVETDTKNTKNQTEKCYQCRICRFQVPTEDDLLKHTVNSHSNQFYIDGKFYYCLTCQRKFTRLGAFHNHLKAKHLQQKLEEESTDTGEDDKNNIEGHCDSEDVAVVNVVQKTGIGAKVVSVVPTVKIEDDPPILSPENMLLPEVQKSSSSDHDPHANDNGLGVRGKSSKRRKTTGKDFRCQLCSKMYETVKGLRIHERMIHGDVFISFFNNSVAVEGSKESVGGGRRQKRQKIPRGSFSTISTKSRDDNSMMKCYKDLMEEVRKKLNCAEKLIKKFKEERNRKQNTWASKVTPGGVKIFSRGIKSGNGQSSSTQMNGYKRKKRKNAETASVGGGQFDSGGQGGSSSMPCSKKKDTYQCIFCGNELSNAYGLKRHVMTMHSVKLRWQMRAVQRSRGGGRRRRNGGIRRKKVERREFFGGSDSDSFPIPVIDVDEDKAEREVRKRLLCEQIDEEIIVRKEETCTEVGSLLDGGDGVADVEINNQELLPVVMRNLVKCPEETRGDIKAEEESVVNLNLEGAEEELGRKSINQISPSITKNLLPLPSIPVCPPSNQTGAAVKPNDFVEKQNRTEKTVVTPAAEVLVEKSRSKNCNKKYYNLLNNREVRIVLTRVDDDNFDFSEFSFLKKLC